MVVLGETTPRKIWKFIHVIYIEYIEVVKAGVGFARVLGGKGQ